MPQFTNTDKNMIFAECVMWSIVDLLDDVSAGAFAKRVQELMRDAEILARELRDYNDQFEVSDE